MLVRWEGKEYDFNPDRITVSQAIVIKNYTGMNLQPWQEAIKEVDPIAWQALMWQMRTQSGEQLEISRIDFELSAFADAMTAAREEEEAREKALEEQGKDPAATAAETTHSTGDSSRTSNSYEPNTSSDWPTSATSRHAMYPS